VKILVTGGAGFIGSHTADALMERGHQVRVLDNLQEPTHKNGKPDYLSPDAEFLPGDIRVKRDLESALRGVDVVYHFAAYQDYLPDFSTYYHVNDVGTALLYEIIVEQGLPISKVIVASSQAVYGEGEYRCPECRAVFHPDPRPVEQLRRGLWEHLCPACGIPMTYLPAKEETHNPQNQYAISKYAQEITALHLGKRYGIPTVALRYSIVQGPRQNFHNAYSGACRVFSLCSYFGRPPVLYEDGQQMRDYVDVRDIVEANLLVLEKSEADYRAYNVGGGNGWTVLELARMIAREFGRSTDISPSGKFRFGDTRHALSDINSLNELGWEPRYTPQESVREYAYWLKEQVDVDDIIEHVQNEMESLGVVQAVERGVGEKLVRQT